MGGSPHRLLAPLFLLCTPTHCEWGQGPNPHPPQHPEAPLGCLLQLSSDLDEGSCLRMQGPGAGAESAVGRGRGEAVPSVLVVGPAPGHPSLGLAPCTLLRLAGATCAPGAPALFLGGGTGSEPGFPPLIRARGRGLPPLPQPLQALAPKSGMGEAGQAASLASGDRGSLGSGCCSAPQKEKERPRARPVQKKNKKM